MDEGEAMRRRGVPAIPCAVGCAALVAAGLGGCTVYANGNMAGDVVALRDATAVWPSGTRNNVVVFASSFPDTCATISAWSLGAHDHDTDAWNAIFPDDHWVLILQAFSLDGSDLTPGTFRVSTGITAFTPDGEIVGGLDGDGLHALAGTLIHQRVARGPTSGFLTFSDDMVVGNVIGGEAALRFSGDSVSGTVDLGLSNLANGQRIGALSASLDVDPCPTDQGTPSYP